MAPTEDGHLVLWKLANQPEAWEALISTVILRPSASLGSLSVEWQ